MRAHRGSMRRWSGLLGVAVAAAVGGYAARAVLSAQATAERRAPGFVSDIEDAALQNDYFRRVLFTAPHSQLVVMSLGPGEDIGVETHANVDQFFRVERGQGTALLEDQEYRLKDGYAVVVPAGTRHNIINASTSEPLKLYTIYSPPQHPDGTIHKTKADATETAAKNQ